MATEAMGSAKGRAQGTAADPLTTLRNIGVIAHIDAGKTTVTERILYHTGHINRLGNVDDGSTVTDFMPQERERGITIQSAAVTSSWRDHQINLIDTPGHIDFTAEVQRSLRVLDGGVVVFDGVAGVEPQSETVWHQADRYEVPRICFINKMDRPGASYPQAMRTIADRLGAKPVAIQLPVAGPDRFDGVIDLVSMTAFLYPADGQPIIGGEIPAALRAEAEQAREQLVEQMADLDDEIAMLYLEGEPVSDAQLRSALRAMTLRRSG